MRLADLFIIGLIFLLAILINLAENRIVKAVRLEQKQTRQHLDSAYERAVSHGVAKFIQGQIVRGDP